jgi:hypothetical protein
MLHEIYSQAHVITWLGTGYRTDPTALAGYLSQSARIYTSVVRSAEAAKFDRSQVGRAAAAQFHKRFGERNSKRPHGSCMGEVYMAAYFNRVWVAQEMFLGKSVICQLGSQMFSVAVLNASLALSDYHWPHALDDSREPSDISFSYLDPALNGIWYPVFTEMRDLSIVLQFGSKECADPRDHIYGLSALFESSSAYPVDYSLSVE